MASKYGEPVTNKITLNESIINTDLIHLNICLWYLWYLTTNLMRLISVNQSWTTRMMWHTDMRKAAWCKDCNNKLRCLKHWYLKYLRYSKRNEKHCFNVNEPIRAHRTLSASLHGVRHYTVIMFQSLRQWNANLLHPVLIDPKSET